MGAGREAGNAPGNVGGRLEDRRAEFISCSAAAALVGVPPGAAPPENETQIISR